MASRSLFREVSLSALAAAALVPLGNSAAAQAPVKPEHSTKVVLMLAGHGTDKYLPDPRPDLQRVRQVFVDGVTEANTVRDAEGRPKLDETNERILLRPDQDGFVEFVDFGALDTNFDKDSLIARIREQNVDERTTFVLYLRVHGAWENVGPKPEDPSHHLLFLGGGAGGGDGAIRRTELLAELKKKARLTVLLTESCTSDAVTLGAGGVVQQFGGDVPTLFNDLFLLPAGVVDINSSTFRIEGEGEQKRVIDELTWFFGGEGAFASSFTYLMTSKNPYGQFDSDKNGRITWTEFFPKLRDETCQNFQAGKTAIKNSPPPRPSRRQRLLLELLYEQDCQAPRMFESPED